MVDPPTAKALVCQPLADKNAHTIHVPYLYHTFTSEPFHTNTTNLTRLIPYTYILDGMVYHGVASLIYNPPMTQAKDVLSTLTGCPKHLRLLRLLADLWEDVNLVRH